MKAEPAARLVAGLAVCAALLPAVARADDLSAVYARVERSVVFIECTTQSGRFSGSGFIVASNGAIGVRKGQQRGAFLHLLSSR